MAAKLRCDNRECRWRKDGGCVLFVGNAQLECRYRVPPSGNGAANRSSSGKRKGKQ